MASTHETYEFVKVALESASDAIEAQLRALTLLKDLELAQQKIKRLEERIDHMTTDMSDHFDRRARYMYLKTEMQTGPRCTRKTTPWPRTVQGDSRLRACQRGGEIANVQGEPETGTMTLTATVAAAEHKVETAKAALELRDKLANGVFAKATQRGRSTSTRKLAARMPRT